MLRVLQKSKDGPHFRVTSNGQKQSLLMDGTLVVALVGQKGSAGVYSSYFSSRLRAFDFTESLNQIYIIQPILSLIIFLCFMFYC